MKRKLALDETKGFACQSLKRLICQSNEVLSGWKDAFTTNILGDPEEYVFVPEFPIRSVADVLAFMDLKADLASQPTAFPIHDQSWHTSCLHLGIKCGLLWLIVSGNAELSVVKREMPSGFVEAYALFASVREAVNCTSPIVNPPANRIDKPLILRRILKRHHFDENDKWKHATPMKLETIASLMKGKRGWSAPSISRVFRSVFGSYNKYCHFADNKVTMARYLADSLPQFPRSDGNKSVSVFSVK